ncbi:MAG: hypothetical protein K2J15_00635 [Muribaculaceae bacterium]|nr:hypothetical protein [Muribaculaceae bacterium]
MSKLELLKKFTLFDPQVDDESKIAKTSGFYVILLRQEACLPQCEVAYQPIVVEYEGHRYEIIYVGISTKSLYKRDYLTHFKGNNSGRSTLRKSLGSLMGLTKTYRSPGEKQKPNPKTKFSDEDEKNLSEWMNRNLLLLFYEMPDSELDDFEKEMINYLNPPLNISKNNNLINQRYRNNLKRLRNNLANFVDL